VGDFRAGFAFFNGADVFRAFSIRFPALRGGAAVFRAGFFCRAMDEQRRVGTRRQNA
jgi:hypothetical protein